MSGVEVGSKKVRYLEYESLEECSVLVLLGGGLSELGAGVFKGLFEEFFSKLEETESGFVGCVGLIAARVGANDRSERARGWEE